MSNDLVSLVTPNYRLYRFTDQIYKVIKFKSAGPRPIFISNKEETPHETYDFKLDQSISRARRNILELALCNVWKYFCTFTIAESNYDRKNLATFYKDFSQFIRDQRKKYSIDIKYLLVPEKHKDGSWHLHGLFSDISSILTSFYWLDKNGYNVPYHLVDDGYYCWIDYWFKFGFCSLGAIDDPVACGFYITKYISKELQKDSLPVGLHLYYCSRGLNRSSVHGEIYSHVASLEPLLVNDYEFCKTGMTRVSDGLNWSFCFEHMDFTGLDLLSFRSEADNEESYSFADDFYDSQQLVLECFA